LTAPVPPLEFDRAVEPIGLAGAVFFVFELVAVFRFSNNSVNARERERCLPHRSPDFARAGFAPRTPDLVAISRRA
jgi:hypothetical protein